MTMKKIEKIKIKSEKMVSSKKMYLSLKNKRQIVILSYPSFLNQGRKDDSALMFTRNP